MMKKLVIVGAGGFGRELFLWIKDINRLKQEWEVIGFLSDDKTILDDYSVGVDVVNSIEDYQPEKGVLLALAVGDPLGKKNVVEKLLQKGAEFATIIHPKAIIGDRNRIGTGVVMYPNARVTCDCEIADYVSLLSCAIGHDAKVGTYSTISSNCSVTGFVNIEEGVFIGSNATIAPKLSIGANAVVGIGSVVLKNVEAGQSVIGNPARAFLPKT